MKGTFGPVTESQAYLLAEMSQAAIERFGLRTDQWTLRRAVAEATIDLLARPVAVTDYLGDLTINQVSRSLAR